MPLIDPETPEDQFEYLDRISYQFLDAIKDHYTRDTAVSVMDALVPVLGKDWRGRLIFGIVSGKSASDGIRFTRKASENDVKKIQAIKAVRWISGLGLTEAKALVESAYDRWVSVTFKPMDGITPDKMARYNQLRDTLSELEQSGFQVHRI